MPKKMAKNLLFVSHAENLTGGGEASLLELLKSAKSRGYAVHLALPADGSFVDEAKKNGFKHLIVGYTRWWSSPNERAKLDNLAAISKLADYVDKEKIDVVITNTLTIPWGALAAAVANKPHVWTIREMLTHEREEYQKIYEFIKAYSNLVIANSKTNVAFLKKAGIDAAQFYSYVEAKNLKLGADKSLPDIVCVGIVHPDKNQMEVLRAMAAVKNQQAYGKVVFFGAYRDDDYFKEINSFIESHGLSDRVEFAGYTKDVYAHISPKDILVQPSKQESLGRTITEAMKIGLKTIASDIPGLKEAYGLGGGVSYKLGKPSDLAKKIDSMLVNPKKYSQLAENAKKKAIENMSESASHQPFFDAIATVVGQPNPRGELRHMNRQFAGLPRIQRELAHWEKKTHQYQAALERRQRELDAIYSSKAWKAVVASRKFKSLPRHLMAKNSSTPILFVYPTKRQFSGSTVMRGQQLSDIAKKYIKGHRIEYASLDLEVKNSVLFLTKWSLAALKPEYLDKLKTNRNILLFDPVDAVLPEFSKDYADIVVAASHTAQADYQKQVGEDRVFLLNHHVDPRINFNASRQPKDLKAAYFGELVNTYATPKIEKLVDFVQVSTDKQHDDWFDRLSDYNFHYAIRHFDSHHSASDNHKPFLKGFTAAHCYSNMLIQDNQVEAITWLGKDYPYLIKGEPDEQKIIDMIEHAKSSVGSAEWRRGLDIMERIRNQTSEPAIGKQLKELFERVL